MKIKHVLASVVCTSLVACGGGGSSTANDPSMPATPATPTNAIAAITSPADGKLQWKISSPIAVTLKDSAGVNLVGTLSCTSSDVSALVVAADCSTATAQRVGVYTVSVTNGTATATASLKNIPQRYALADAKISSGNGSGPTFAVLPSDGAPWLWGSNAFGLLSQTLTFGQLTSMGLPVRAKLSASAPMQGITSVAIGVGTGLAVNEGGEVYSWGYNNLGTLGRSKADTDVVPDKVRNGTDTGTLTGIVQVSSGDWNVAALGDDGYVNAWGWGYTVGRGKIDGAQRPNRVQLPDGTSLSNVVQISAGETFHLALTASGNVYAWGANGEGQTSSSQPNTFGSYVFYAYPVLDANNQPIADIVSISAGYNHSLALTRSGQVYAWGFNGSGGLGIGSKNSTRVQATFVKSIDGMSNLTNITAITAGNLFNLALDTSGQVLSWGAAYNGQLGQGIGSSVGNERVLPGYVVDIAGTGKLKGVVALGVVATSSYALLADGSVVAWGLNGSNELGQNLDNKTLYESFTPRKVKDAAGTATLTIGSLADFKNLTRRFR